MISAVNELKLEFPTLKRKEEALTYIKEFREHNSEIHGSGGLDVVTSYETWLRKTENNSLGINIDDNRVQATTFFAIVNDDIVGMVNIRHELNDFLITHGYGHIGYSVRPLSRRRGYATKILELSLLFCHNINIKDVHIGCYKDNLASRKTIEKNGGELHREFQDEQGSTNLEFIVKQ